MHAFDATTAIEEVARALDDLVAARKVRYAGASNFQGVGGVVWSPLGWSLDQAQRDRLDQASATPLAYPYRHQRFLPDLLASPWTSPVAHRVPA
jgi:hypothetical protein